MSQFLLPKRAWKLETKFKVKFLASNKGFWRMTNHMNMSEWVEANLFSPVCVFMCSSKYCFMLKSLPHHWHMNCLCPMWMLMWERSWYLYWNRSSQFYRDNRGIQLTCMHTPGQYSSVQTQKLAENGFNLKCLTVMKDDRLPHNIYNSVNFEHYQVIYSKHKSWDLVYRYTAVL